MSPFSRKATSEHEKTVQAALLDLSRAGILVMGVQDGELTYKVTEEFAEVLTNCANIIVDFKVYGKDSLGTTALLALASWYGELAEERACRLLEALVGVLSVSLEEGT